MLYFPRRARNPPVNDGEAGGVTRSGQGVRVRLSRLVGRILALGADPADRAEERARKALLVAVSLGFLPAGALWGALYWALDEPVAALFPWGYDAASLAVLALYARTRSFRLLRDAELALILVTPALLQLVLGGFTAASGVILWSLLAPLAALVFDSPGRARWWFAGFAALLAGSIPLAPVVRPDEAGLPEGAVIAFGALNIGAVSLVAFTLLAAFARQRELAQRRAESLLLNILPDEIAERLKLAPQTIADHFDAASILFADVVDFTPLSARLGPQDLVELLDRLFTSFDELADRYGVEKIKTIGDCYMVAAGVPRPRADHAHALVRMAFEMQRCARECLPGGDRDLRLRIGISSGPVVAGVIGRRRFLYDLWGDTVNMASRMESHGSPDAIQVTRATWELIRDAFETQARGPVPVKGKGEVETWYVLAPRA
ncbi:MAG TPA: adenylate/guanylate cyclase domain-containing protein [Gaiellaceae bacterium]|nr:adenylate/guanylate cyclase domain-containing protein [Gaiellaceae bacterium]